MQGAVLTVVFASILVIMAGCSSQINNGESLLNAGNGPNTTKSSNGDYDSIEEFTGDQVVLASNNGNVLSTYATEFTKEPATRNHNIKLAADNINETVIQPGSVFSFNKEVGPTGKNDGFKKARIFVNGKDSSGYGGGVCQVSSTVYNAALAANMEIVERHPHTKKVSYVPKDKDAATSYGDNLDFQFKNNKPHAIKIVTKTEATKVTISIVKA